MYLDLYQEEKKRKWNSNVRLFNSFIIDDVASGSGATHEQNRNYFRQLACTQQELSN